MNKENEKLAGQIPCEMIQDLLPSYIDKLTGSTSNSLIEEHLAGCEICTEVLHSMQGDNQEKAEQSKEKDQKELDFLKKTRHRVRRIVLCCLAALLVILGVLFVTRYMLGESRSDMRGDFYMWDLETDGSSLTLTGTVVDDIYRIINISFTQKEGIVYGDAKWVPSGFVASRLYPREYHASYTAPEPIRQIIVNGRILWNEGQAVSTKASGVYLSRHPYMGSMPDNSFTANMLNISNYLGPFLNELQSSESPLTWKLLLQEDIASDQLEILESDMDAFGYVLLGVIQNLEQVSYEYTTGGKKMTRSVTLEDASGILGQDIKNCYDNVCLLDELFRLTGLDRYVFGSVLMKNAVEYESVSPASHYFYIINNSEEALQSIEAVIYVNGTEAQTCEAEGNDDGLIESGELTSVFIHSEALPETSGFNAQLEVSIRVKNAEGASFDIPGQLRLPAGGTKLWDIHITGNSTDGFSVSQ